LIDFQYAIAITVAVNKIDRRNAVFLCFWGQKNCDLGGFSEFSVFSVLSVMAKAIDNHSAIAKYSRKYSSRKFGDCFDWGYLCVVLEAERALEDK
jgi:hypothetical protein